MRCMPALRMVSARALWLVSMLVLGGWGLGRVASDRWVWSQYLLWVPTVVALSVGGVLLVGAWVLDPRRRRWRARHAGGVLWLVSALVLVFGELDVARRISARDDSDLRIVFWNASNQLLEYPPALISEHRPDLVVVVNPRWRMGREMFATTVVPGRARDGHVLWRSGFAVASRYPIVEHGATTLGLRGVRAGMDPETDGELAFDRGHAVFFVLDTTADLGRQIVVWAIDMPSDPRQGRMANARRARARIDAWRGTNGRRGFPEADIVVGDLNVPRGSASLGVLCPSMHDAGGVLGTWPRRWALWQLDHVLFDPRAWRLTKLRAIDPGIGTHRMLAGELRMR